MSRAGETAAAAAAAAAIAAAAELKQASCRSWKPEQRALLGAHSLSLPFFIF